MHWLGIESGSPAWEARILPLNHQCFASLLVAQKVKCLPAMQETWVRSLDWQDPLEKEMATHSSTLAWKIPWREEPGRLQSMGSQSRHDRVASLSLSKTKKLPEKRVRLCCQFPFLSENVCLYVKSPGRRLFFY